MIYVDSTWRKHKILQAIDESYNGFIEVERLYINHNGAKAEGKPCITWSQMSDRQIDALYQFLKNLGVLDGKYLKYVCGHCGFKALPTAFYRGRGREYGEHPEHTYCPHCGQSITWHSFKTIREEPDYCDQCNGTDPECGICEYIAPYPRKLKEVM